MPFQDAMRQHHLLNQRRCVIVMHRRFRVVSVMAVANLFAWMELDFAPDPRQRQLNLTFRLLMRLCRAVMILIAIWAVAAGFASVDQPAAGDSGWSTVASSGLSLLMHALEAFGAAALLALAAGLAGALLGFLFGVPRQIADAPAVTPVSPRDPQLPSVAAKPSANVSVAPLRGWRSSTNLTRISDWLTNIIVGVSLVEAKPIVREFASFSLQLSNGLLKGVAGGKLVVPALLIAGSIIGFLFSYLFTQLFLAELMADSDSRVRNPFEEDLPELTAVLNVRSAGSDAAYRPISPGSGGDRRPSSQATSAEQDAAKKISTFSLSELGQNPSVVQAWSRGKSILSDLSAAAMGMRQLISMVPNDPALSMEAARALYADGSKEEAARLLDGAMARLADLPEEVRSRTLADACNLALYEDETGYEKVLAWLTNAVVDGDRRGTLHVLRACALGQKQAASPVDDPQREERAREALQLLNAAIVRDQANKAWIAYLMDPHAQGKAALRPEERDDDLVPFAAEPGFSEVARS